MFVKLLQDSIAVLRQPTVKSFQEINVDSWQWSFIYLGIGSVVTTATAIVTNLLQAPAREQQRLEILQRFGPSSFTSLLNNMQKPLFTLAIAVIGFFAVILLWILLPFWLGRILGGSKSFGRFAYNSSLFIVPTNILESLLALTLSGLIGGLYTVLSLSIDAFRFYLIYVNLQATMGLSKGKAALAVFIPIFMAVFLFCGVMAYIAVTAFPR